MKRRWATSMEPYASYAVNSVLGTGFVLLGVLPGLYVVLRLFFLPASWFMDGATEQALLDSVISGLAATVFGILIGIPVAIWLSNKQQIVSEERKKVEEEQERTKREQFILSTIRDELHTNRSILEEMLEQQEKRPTIMPIMGMKNVNWQVLADSGELKWINNIAILLRLSEVYYHIEALIYLEKQYTDIHGYEYIVLNQKQEIALSRVHKIRPEALKHINSTMEEINERIGSDIQSSEGEITGFPKKFDP